MANPVPMGMSLQMYIEMLHLQDIMRANQMAVAAVADNEASAAGRMLAGVTGEVLEALRARSPILYGVLRMAHRAEISPTKGHIFIDPTVVHPVLGGRPVIYGAKLHREGRPWFDQTVQQDVPEILAKYTADFVDEIEVIYGN